MSGSFFSNVYDVRRPDAEEKFVRMAMEWGNGPPSEAQARHQWRVHQKHIECMIVDRPQASPKMSTEDLEAEGYVGVFWTQEGHDKWLAWLKSEFNG